MHHLLGEQLELLCAEVSNEALLVAPFVKEHALKRILSHLGSEVALTVVTRWNPLEIQAGVSDLEVWHLIKERKNASLLLCSHLHAKYFKLDDRCIVGSANITGRALGWNNKPNLELLVEVDYELSGLFNFEQILFASSTAVDEFIYQQTREAVEALPKATKVDATEVIPEAEISSEQLTSGSTPLAPISWLPTTRHPETLFQAYCGEIDNLTRASRDSTASDLRFLELPDGLSSESFNVYVGAMLLQCPLISQIDGFLAVPQRFGGVTKFLKSLPCADNPDFDASHTWQTLIRWFARFLPGRYIKVKSDYSEVFVRKQES